MQNIRILVISSVKTVTLDRAGKICFVNGVSLNEIRLTRSGTAIRALSSVTVFTEEMGRIAVDTLNRQLINPEVVPTMTRLATRLTIRDSSG